MTLAACTGSSTASMISLDSLRTITIVAASTTIESFARFMTVFMTPRMPKTRLMPAMGLRRLRSGVSGLVVKSRPVWPTMARVIPTNMMSMTGASAAPASMAVDRTRDRVLSVEAMKPEASAESAFTSMLCIRPVMKVPKRKSVTNAMMRLSTPVRSWLLGTCPLRRASASLRPVGSSVFSPSSAIR